MEKGKFLSRKESSIIQGIAVMLMVYHHLFGFPDRIVSEYVIVSNFSFLHIGTILSYFGRICISVFAFCSGYGVYKKLSSIYTYSFIANIKIGYAAIFKQAIKFFARYWIVCALFIPIGYIMGVYSFQLVPLLKCLFGITFPYNVEWWYVNTYLTFLIYVPLFVAVEKVIYKYCSQVIVNVLYLFIFICGVALSKLSISDYTVELCFVSGIACVSINVYDKFYFSLCKVGTFKYILSIFLVVTLALLRMILGLGCNYDFICAPIFVFGIGMIIKCKLFTNYINRVLLFIGKYSTYIWLTHTFFAYYYFQQYLYWFRYSTIIFVVCLICCIIIGMVCEIIIKLISKVLMKNKLVVSND